MISVIVLAKDEEINIKTCLKHLVWSDDVHVLDSGSTDNTIKIAFQYNAKISTNPFETFGKQRNFALDHIQLKYDWILFLDADEVVTKRFQSEIHQAINNADDRIAGFYCCWKMMLENRWLRYSDNFPKWQFRLMRKGRARFTDFGHGQKEASVNGVIEYIKEPYLHYAFSKGWFQWLERHNNYSSKEAFFRYNHCPPLIEIFAKSPSQRNLAIKSWLTKVPGWPFFRFFQAYFLNLGFIDGTPGFIYCTNMAYYEFLIQIKTRELKRIEGNDSG